MPQSQRCIKVVEVKHTWPRHSESQRVDSERKCSIA
jgi:hypothetical protein